MTWSRLWHDPIGFLWRALTTRGVRLSMYLIVAAALFPSSRFILTIVLLLTLSVMWVKDYRIGKSPKIWYLAAAVGILLVGYGFARFDVKRVDDLRLAKSPWGSGIALVEDGTYRGSGDGFRGPIEVQVGVRDHRITAIRTLEYPDLISVEDSELTSYRDEILKNGKLEPPGQPAMYRGAGLTLTGYANAVESALSRGIPDYPQYSVISRVFLNAFLGKAPDRVTLNALAILFAAFIVFEYAGAIHAYAWNGTFHQLLQLCDLCRRMPGQGSGRCSDAHGTGSAY